MEVVASSLDGEVNVLAEPTDTHVGPLLESGALLGFMDGAQYQRPSIEVRAGEVRARMDVSGTWGVFRFSGELEWDAWVRDALGPVEQELLWGGGEGIPFPPNGIVSWNDDEPLGTEASPPR